MGSRWRVLENDTIVFASVHSSEHVTKLSNGTIVTAAGLPQMVQGYEMLPISHPQGAVQLSTNTGDLLELVSAAERAMDLVAAPQADLARENERLRLENRVLREEREIVKRRLSSSRAKGREVRFRA